MLMVAKPSDAIGMDAITIGPFHLKPFSPMNAGAWALLGFSLFAFLAALDVFLEGRGGRSMRTLRVVVGVIGDRKSTRLNSSHSQISYAVFCLKKKKKESDQ